MINNIKTQFIKNFVKQLSQGKSSGLNLKNGEVLLTSVKKLNPNGNPIINIKGKLFLAESQIPLKKGDNIQVKVNGKVNGKYNLKVVNNLSSNDAKVLEKQNIQVNNKNLMAAKMLKNMNIPVTAKNIINLTNLASKLGSNTNANMQFLSMLQGNIENLNENIVNLFKSGILNSKLNENLKKLEKYFVDNPKLENLMALIKSSKIDDLENIPDSIKKQLSSLGFDLEKKVKDALSKEEKGKKKFNRQNLSKTIKEELLKLIDELEKDGNKNENLKKLLKETLDSITSKELISKSNSKVINFELVFADSFGFNKSELMIFDEDEDDDENEDNEKDDNKIVFLDLDMTNLDKVRVFARKKKNIVDLEIYVTNDDVKEFLNENINELKNKNFKHDIKINNVFIEVDKSVIEKNILKDYFNLDDIESVDNNSPNQGIDIKI